mmetsp:Transcript_49737/g.98346  ORF Transcript_49737/g.98346 Transcript_49737/m.98346 type:complete len:224 (+) Transcript_49737:571-1242(+)
MERSHRKLQRRMRQASCAQHGRYSGHQRLHLRADRYCHRQAHGRGGDCHPIKQRSSSKGADVPRCVQEGIPWGAIGLQGSQNRRPECDSDHTIKAALRRPSCLIKCQWARADLRVSVATAGAHRGTSALLHGSPRRMRPRQRHRRPALAAARITGPTVPAIRSPGFLAERHGGPVLPQLETAAAGFLSVCAACRPIGGQRLCSGFILPLPVLAAQWRAALGMA